MTPTISVLIATYNRAEVLRRTLESMCALDQTQASAEIIVADNNSTDNTKEVIESFRNHLPVKYCFERKQGKNAALNQAVELARGKLFIFTDDDVLVDPDWLVEWAEGVARWPNYDVFGGPILPNWPCALPDHIHSIPFYEMTFCVLDPKQEEGPFVTGRPFGPNLGIRRHIFESEGFRYNEKVGPSKGNYIMGSESELLKRLETAGHKAIYLPRIGVQHIIRAEQLTTKWLYARAYRYGRSLRYGSRDENVNTVCGYPRYLLGYLATTILKRCKHLAMVNRTGFFREGINYWMIRGQLRQARIDRTEREKT
jgi:glycosyltransferase involved in cell wall biosynthesis